MRIDSKIEVPPELIKELKSPKRKRPLRTILRENWKLIEDIDNKLKNDEKLPENLPTVVAFAIQNFMTIFSFLVSSRKSSLKKRKEQDECEKVSQLEEDLRVAQKNWNSFFDKYEKEIDMFVKLAKTKANVDFHGELWQKSKIQKLTAVVSKLSQEIHDKTLRFIPLSSYIFSFVGFLASWTVVPVINTPRRISAVTESFLKKDRSSEKEQTKRKEKERPTNSISLRKFSFIEKESDASKKFHDAMEQSDKNIIEKEHQWGEKLNKFQKEISARLEVQEKRLFAGIEQFEEEKRLRREEEAEEFEALMERQNLEFQKIINKIDVERKQFSETECNELLASCQQQNKELLELFDNSDSSDFSHFHWDNHEDYWSSQLEIHRSALSVIRSEFWNFKKYLRPYLENPHSNPNFLKTIYDMESASFGRTVTRAQSLISKQTEFYDLLYEKYDDDLFLKIIWKITNDISIRLDKIILELWTLAVNPSEYDYYTLEAAVMEVDPHMLPTSWRLKGICHSAEPSDYDDTFSISSHSLSSSVF